VRAAHARPFEVRCRGVALSHFDLELSLWQNRPAARPG